ncbi:MAG: DUF5716 family protein [Lachnospiraceae bacterium]
MFEKLDGFDKDKLYIGYDLGMDYGEISYFTTYDKELKTVISREDATLFHFPSTLVKYGNHYYAGMDAMKYKDVEGAIVFERVLELALTQPSLVVNGTRYETVTLLVLFLKLTLKQLGESYASQKAQAIVFTTYVAETKEYQMPLYEVLGKAAKLVFSKKTKVYLQTRSESIYYYLFYQEDALYEGNALVYEYQQECLKSFFVQIKGQTAPYGVQITSDAHESLAVMKNSITQLKVPRFKKQLDETFYQIINKQNTTKQYQVAYLIGDGFKGEWLEQSLDILCEKARIFQGNNMYSLGACYQLLQMLEPKTSFEEYLLVEKDTITYEIGMFTFKQGFLQEEIEESYDLIFKAGTNYHDCEKIFCLIPEDEMQLVLIARHTYSEVEHTLRISLEGLPSRQIGETKLEVVLRFIMPQELSVSVRDIGIADIVEGSKFMVSEIFRLE